MSTTTTLHDSLEKLRHLQPSSPKRNASLGSSADWYSYYAGYADGFVKDIVGVLPAEAMTVLDPWNGSGTTTAVATLHSLQSKGFDLNPAAVVIAKARILRSDVAGSIAPLTEEILGSADLEAARTAGSSDLLGTWIAAGSAAYIRAIEIRIRQLLIGADAGRVIGSVNEISSLAALFYLGLFRSVRTLLARFVGSNPTWIRRRVGGRERLRPSQQTVNDLFCRAMMELAKLVEAASHAYDDQHCPCDVEIGSSLSLPLESDTIDAVITSPPYCTRIDYAVATLPELAVLGLRADELKDLRDKMIGTPTIASSEDEVPPECDRAADLIAEISTHDSKASSGYYRRFFSRYFDGMHRSLSEIRRVVKDGSPAVLVVQDSYYKEVHVDLAGIIEDMAGTVGWTSLARHDFPVIPRRNYATINPRSRVYRERTEATESVLVLGAS
jgi:hypothetical protein